jgi:perosamine synthetase
VLYAFKAFGLNWKNFDMERKKVALTYRSFEQKSLLSFPKLGAHDRDSFSKHFFDFMKSAATLEQLFSRSVEFEGEGFESFRLVPVASLHLNDENLIAKLAQWRNEVIHLYHDAAPATQDGTKLWMSRHVLLNPDRLLFLIIDQNGSPLGHLGLWRRDSNKFEIDNVLKGDAKAPKGVMSQALVTLILWAQEYLNVTQLPLRVLKSNSHAISFYSKLKFVQIDEIDVALDQNGSSRNLVETNSANSAHDSWVVMQVEVEDHRPAVPYILTAGPSIGPVEVSLVSEAVKTGWNNHHSDYLVDFAKEFGSYVQAEFAIPTDSCTSALHMALWSLDIGPGDEVIVPEVTWVATANAVKYVGATPIFADIDKETWCINPDSVESLITPRTKAIMPVHLYGFVGDLKRVREIADKHGLHVVQDAAPGIGSMFDGQSASKLGDIACFSFQGAKLLVSGEGGVLTTNSREIFEKAFKIGDSGRQPGTFWIDSYGKKMKMSNPTAALAYSQLQSAERQIEQKRLIREWYVEGLSDLEGLAFQKEIQGSRSIAWMTSLSIDHETFDREAFRESLLKRGIETRPVFPPISQYPIWGKKIEPQPVAQWVGSNSINLPSGVRLSRESVNYVCEVIRELHRKF